jgi:hypothetical protein
MPDRLRDGLRALVMPRVGEYVHGLGPASVIWA